MKFIQQRGTSAVLASLLATVWTFNRAGDFDFACPIAGHYQAGMVGKIKVIAATAKTARSDDHAEHKH
nr:hypothetical protein [Roseateles sp.]